MILYRVNFSVNLKFNMKWDMGLYSCFRLYKGHFEREK
jgi:hypothetical protein